MGEEGISDLPGTELHIHEWALLSAICTGGIRRGPFPRGAVDRDGGVPGLEVRTPVVPRCEGTAEVSGPSLHKADPAFCPVVQGCLQSCVPEQHSP